MRIAPRPLALAALLALTPAAAPAFDLQGHRGARGLAPENTLAGFAAALAIGVSTLELDVGVSADGAVVVAHDRRLNPALTRGRDGRWLAEAGPTLRSLTLAALGDYDVGRLDPASRLAALHPEQVPADGERMPALAEVFALVAKAGNRTVRFNIETKLSPEAPDETAPPEEMVARLLTIVREAGLEARVTVQSFDWRTLLLVKREEPRISTACLTVERAWLDNLRRGRPGPSPWTAGLDIDRAASLPALVRQAGCDIWSPYHEDLSPPELAAARALGLAVIPWTVNAPERMEALLGLGVDGLITDYPDRLRRVLAARGLALPAPTPASP